MKFPLQKLAAQKSNSLPIDQENTCEDAGKTKHTRNVFWVAFVPFLVSSRNAPRGGVLRDERLKLGAWETRDGPVPNL